MEQINNDCGEIGSLNWLLGLPTNKFIIEEDGIVFKPPINPAAELIKKYKEFLIDKLDIVYKYHYTFGFKDLKLVLELDRFGNDEFWDEEDSDEEDEDCEEEENLVERVINNPKLDGYNLIKILKELPITIITLKDKIIGGQVNSVYSLQTNDRFISNSNNLTIYDYYTYGFNLEKQVITITYTYGLNPTETFTIVLNEIENNLVRKMIMF
tara:strand:- start:68 stop:700 length:633 start_codon:yes stop_codon:yes gene_type:complete